MHQHNTTAKRDLHKWKLKTAKLFSPWLNIRRQVESSSSIYANRMSCPYMCRYWSTFSLLNRFVCFIVLSVVLCVPVWLSYEGVRHYCSILYAVHISSEHQFSTEMEKNLTWRGISPPLVSFKHKVVMMLSSTWTEKQTTAAVSNQYPAFGSEKSHYPMFNGGFSGSSLGQRCGYMIVMVQTRLVY